MRRRTDLRNLAIIAHVDHGKTTLVDALLRQSGTFRDNQRVAERVMDSFDLERERGITILAKNTSVHYQGVKINIVDTPGHADFGGEVERALSMVDGVLLVVDAAEGPMPQTRYVLRKALEAKLPAVVFINKVDRQDARPKEVQDAVLDLFIALGADDHLLDFPVLFGSGRAGVAGLEPGQGNDLRPLFDTLLAHLPAPSVEEGEGLTMLVSSIDADPYQGRVVVGRIHGGRLEPGQELRFGRHPEELKSGKTMKVYIYEGLERVEVAAAEAGEVVAVTGIDATIGDTLLGAGMDQPLPAAKVDEPTLQMVFSVNDSPFAGRDGRYLTSRHLRQRLFREMEKNVALRVEETDSPDAFLVAGRGELHLSILIETMRREGYEFAVGKPEVIRRQVNGQWHEPYEELVVDVPEEALGAVMEEVGKRRGELSLVEDGPVGSRRLVFSIPARGLIGLRQELLMQTRGLAVLNHVFAGYGPEAGPIGGRRAGSLVAVEMGEASTYALHHLADRGVFFVLPQTQVYPGMVVGEHIREKDLEVNVCKTRQATNVRSPTADETLRPGPSRILSLEEAVEFLADDELLEVTPKALRLRKQVLDSHARARLEKAKARPD